MNSKEKNIDRLYKARTAHMQWLNYIKLLVSGLNMKKTPPTPILQDSIFGQWYYNEALHFTHFNSEQALNSMETILEAMYSTYAKIYAIYFARKKGLMKSMLGLNGFVSSNDKELASRYYEDIVFLSDKLKKSLGVLERQMFALPLEEHERVNVYVDVNNKNEDAASTEPERNESEGQKYFNGPRSR